MAKGCVACGAPIGLSRADAATCGARCRKRVSRPVVLPVVMRFARRWVAWDLVEGRKVPISPGGRYASVTDPSTWTSFEDVAGGRFGFVLGDGIGCWDFDGCLSDGVLAPWVRERLALIDRPLFVEVSQSGHGLHVFVEAEEAPGSNRVVDGHRVEFYSRDRFIAMTGRRFWI